ncbi:MAG: hypothetical protein F6K48_01530 [Okeania sp. SIO3H1]|uniref:hypothetical protein n=1 Tax=Okeania sp. SIO1I7 TaxID=2607772 RepID=UPI0013CD59F7|nr:hypothetical protein [Okeania sp. SIO1I7]NEN87669.1 hypothetical protein [Okeania sp. SIO3H1]NET28511.1 hypothetical protein [Okeania sp. SIO1I7]
MVFIPLWYCSEGRRKKEEGRRISTTTSNSQFLVKFLFVYWECRSDGITTFPNKFTADSTLVRYTHAGKMPALETFDFY